MSHLETEENEDEKELLSKQVPTTVEGATGEEVPSRVGITIPLSVLLDTQHHGLEVAVELQTGYTYRGVLSSVDDSMNVVMSNVTVTKEGTSFHAKKDDVFIRGQQIVFFVLPPALEPNYIIKAKRIRNKIHNVKRKRRKSARKAKEEYDKQQKAVERGRGRGGRGRAGGRGRGGGRGGGRGKMKSA